MLALDSPITLSFNHGVAYGNQVAKRPIIVVEFAAIDVNGILLGSTTTNALVDSGADVTMLNADIAIQLGLDLQTMNLGRVEGVGGSTPVYEPNTPVLANLCGQWTPVPICFEANRDTNLLGRAGAFDAMHLAFMHGASVLLAVRA